MLGSPPRTISRYFSPSGERGRIVKVVSGGSSPVGLVDLHVDLGGRAGRPGSRTVSIELTTPTRTPPSRTSEPLPSAAAFSARTRTSSEGTNGSPLLAL